MLHIKKHTLLIQMLIILVFGIIFIFASRYASEVIPANGGLGFDGKHYAQLATDFPNNITKAQDSKYFQRSAPAFIVYLGSKAFGLEPSNKNLILLFSCLNLMLLLLSVYGWNKVCRVSGFNNLSNWLGFTALFLNFASLKFPFYYPILTDSMGFALSIFLLLFYKTNNKPAILVVMLLSALAWPAIEYMCIVFLVFQNITIQSSLRSEKLNTFISFLIAFVFTGLAGYLIYRHPHMRGGWQDPTYIVKHGIIPSLLATFFVIFFAFSLLLKKLDLFSIPVFKIFDIKFGIAGIVLFIGIDVVIKKIANHYNIPSGYSIRMYLNDILIIGSRQPFCFLVGHLAYFGPLFAICIFRWKQICAIVYEYGWQMFFIILQFLFFMLDSESRHILNYMPFITLLLIQSFKNKIQKNFVFGMFILSFVFSKAWISMSVFPTSNISENYNVNFGCYLSDEAYILQLLIFTFTSGVIYFTLKKITK